MDNKKRDDAFFAGILIGAYDFAIEIKKLDLSFDFYEFSFTQYKKYSRDEKNAIIKRAKILLEQMEEKENVSTN